MILEIELLIWNLLRKHLNQIASRTIYLSTIYSALVIEINTVLYILLQQDMITPLKK